MARISSYATDGNVGDGDAWIGTSGSATKQFTAKAVSDYLNNKGKISIVGQVNYQLVKLVDIKQGSFAFATPVGNTIPWAGITSIIISSQDASTQEATSILSYLVDEQILFQDTSRKDSFGHYIIKSYQPQAPGFYTLTLEYIGSSGDMFLNRHYAISNFYLEQGASGVTSIDSSNTDFINMTPAVATSGNVDLTASLSAAGTPSTDNFLRGDNSWASLPGAGFLSDYFDEFTYVAGVLTVIKTFEDNTKAVELFTKTFTYTNGLLTLLATLNVITNVTSTKAFSYDAANSLINITKS